MFRAFLNDECFYDDRLEQTSIRGLKVTLEENKAGSFEFSIYPDNSYYSAFEKLASIVRVEQNGKTIFRGRVLNSEESFFKERKITCEGEYAFFNDGIFYPMGQDTGEDEYGEEQITPYTPVEIFSQIITDYNSQVTEEKKFLIGNISITGSTEEIGYANMEFTKTIDALDDLIERCGGHFIFRHEEEGVYIDWTENYDLINQDVSFGENLLDLTQTVQGEDVITAILPYGDTNEDTNWPSNITGIEIPTTDMHKQMGVIPNAPDNSRDEQFGEYGSYLVNIPLYEKYGLIIEERSYEGSPADWKDQLIEDVDNLTGLSNTIEVNAVDMAWLNDVDFFQLGKKVKVFSDKHGINDTYNITKLEIDLRNPASNKFTLGKVIPNFIEQVIQGDKVKPIDGQSIKITGYEWAYAISDNGTVVPDDSLFSESYAPEQGKWLWTRVTTKYNDGTETKIYYPSYLGEDAKQFKIKADSTVIVRNDRRSDVQTITFKADISGYPNAIPLWYINGEKVGEGSTYIRSVPYKNAEGFSINLYDGTTLMDTLNLTVLDKTGGAIYLGACENAVPTQTPDGGSLIVGDYFLCSKSFSDFLAGNPYVYDGNSFVNVIVTGDDNNVSPELFGTIMATSLDDALSSDTVENTKFMSWFKRIASKEAFIENLFAQIITVLGKFIFRKIIGEYLATLEINQEGLIANYGLANETNRSTIFRIDFESGNVYFGQDDSAADSGVFMYQASDKTIRSKDGNVIIKSDGSLEAIGASISGEIITPGFESRVGSVTSVDTTIPSTQDAGRTVYNTLINAKFPTGVYLKCSINNQDDYYLMFSYIHKTTGSILGQEISGTDHYRLYLYNSSYNRISFEDVGITLTGTADQFMDEPDGSIYFWKWTGTNVGDNGIYPSQSVSLKVYAGGQVVLFKDLPTTDVGLASGQVYVSNGTLKVVP